MKIVVVCGPTAAGKTRLGARLAEALDAEVIGADSRQVYIGLDIGTSKPTAEEKGSVPHHLIDVVPPDGEFNAFLYMNMARRTAGEIARRGKRIIVVGGTGLYLKVLTQGLIPGIGPYPEMRSKLREELDAFGPGALYDRLRAVDPEAARRIKPADSFRVVRALEVFRATGTPLSTLQRDHGFADSPYEVLWVGVNRPRPLLYARIEDRVEKMFRRGLVEEVAALRQRGFTAALAPMRTLGYAETGDYLDGRSSLEKAKTAIGVNTRRFAKRQMTWFRAQRQVRWYDPGDERAISGDVRRFYDHAAA